MRGGARFLLDVINGHDSFKMIRNRRRSMERSPSLTRVALVVGVVIRFIVRVGKVGVFRDLQKDSTVFIEPFIANGKEVFESACFDPKFFEKWGELPFIIDIALGVVIRKEVDGARSGNIEVRIDRIIH